MSTDKIISRPSNQAYRDGWDRVFHKNVNSVEISSYLISLVRQELNLNSTFSNEFIMEFIVYSGIYEDTWCYWHLLSELWDDWISK